MQDAGFHDILVGCVGEVKKIASMLDQYELSSDRKILAEVTTNMKKVILR